MSTSPAYGRLNQALSHTAVFILRMIGIFVQLFPPRVWSWMASALTPVLWTMMVKHRKRTLHNLTGVGGLDPKAARIRGYASFRSNLLVFFEGMGMARLLRSARVETVISPEAEAILERARTGENQLTIALSSHSGCWEFLGALAAKMVRPTQTIIPSKLARNPVFSDYLLRMREGFGLTLIERDLFLKHILKTRRENTPTFCVMLCDQHVAKGGLRVPFMGRPACSAPFPATLIRLLKPATLIGGCTRKGPGHYVVEIQAMDIDQFDGLPRAEAMAGITEHIADYMAATIARAPEQWTWGHRRWRECCSMDLASSTPRPVTQRALSGNLTK